MRKKKVRAARREEEMLRRDCLRLIEEKADPEILREISEAGAAVVMISEFSPGLTTMAQALRLKCGLSRFSINMNMMPEKGFDGIVVALNDKTRMPYRVLLE